MKQDRFTVAFFNSDGSENMTYYGVSAWDEKHAYIWAASQQMQAARPIEPYRIEKE